MATAGCQTPSDDAAPNSTPGAPMNLQDRAFDATGYGPLTAQLLLPARVMELGPGRPNEPLRVHLARRSAADLFAPVTVRDERLATGCLAGLWLYHDLLDESHAISQELHTAEGSYWHGMLHRREPDPDNAKYWFRKVGRHAVFQPLHEAAARRARHEVQLPAAAAFLINQRAWDPYRWIDLCEAARTGAVDCAVLCRDVAQREWELLFDYCWCGATER
jgi:hypothetical protein